MDRNTRSSSVRRETTLNEAEMQAFWIAAGLLGYPYGPFFRLLFAGGQRPSEWIEAQWSQINLTSKIFVIPSPLCIPQIVPLSDLMMEIIAELPRSSSGDSNSFIFSFTDGRMPMSSTVHGKYKLDRLMLDHLQNRVADHDGQPRMAEQTWSIYHLRRTVGIQLSRLGIDPNTAEAVFGRDHSGFGHIEKTRVGTDDKRRALQTWADELRRVVGRKR